MTQSDTKNTTTLRGTVVSNKMDKTVVVAVERFVKHPKYKKFYKITKRYKAHDDKNVYNEGDYVLIQSVRPISKQKNFMVVGYVNTTNA
jgi:small subunit ribosomal protein S17